VPSRATCVSPADLIAAAVASAMWTTGMLTAAAMAGQRVVTAQIRQLCAVLHRGGLAAAQPQCGAGERCGRNGCG